jgi:diacylglycerol kinase
VNTAIEKLCDMVRPEQHPGIRYIKDISAAAVFMACLVSVIIGAVIFVPRLIE